MAKRTERSRRLLANALGPKRKLSFDSYALDDVSAKRTQDPTSDTFPQSYHQAPNQDDIDLSSNEIKTDQLTNQTNEVLKESTSLSEPSTSHSQSHLLSCANNIQSKICILSDKTICGPSELVIQSLSRKRTAKQDVSLSQCHYLSTVSQMTLDVPIAIHNSSTISTSTDCKDITASSGIKETKAADELSPYYWKKPAWTKPLSPVILINNEGYTSSNSQHFDTLKNVDFLELPQEEVQLETNLVVNEAEVHIITAADRQESHSTLQNVDVIEPSQDKQLENNLLPEETATETGSGTGVSNKNKSKRKQKLSSYVDFMSDDDDFQWSSSSWEGDDETSGSNEERNSKKKHKKVVENIKVGDLEFKKDKKCNKRKERSINRNRGLTYLKKNGTEVAQKEMKNNPCKPDKKCPHNCHEISKERRRNIFDYYYNLSPQRKRDWLVANSQTAVIKRKRSKENVSRRQNTFNYFINEGEGRRQVCQKFLLHTLDLSQRFVHYTLSNSESNLSKTDLRGKHVPANKTSTLIKQGVVDYIKHLPAVPSHYCRKDSSRLYLPQEFKNLSNLYQLYKADNLSKGKDYVGEKVFKNIFTTEFNIAFHIPKKDKCKKCVSFANNPANNDTEEEKKVHLKEAEDSKARFKFHQTIAKRDPNILCVSFDLQKVLNTPYGESMLFYYSRKYCVYNLTFYESTSREGYCYSWGESDGKRGGNEVATILLKYIQKVDDLKTIKSLLLYSDSCSGQNKNKIVFAAVHTALQACQYIETIQMNFLLPGHTTMPVDSVHAVIENSIKNTVIYAPSQWITVFTLARKNPKPYNVETLKYSDFVAWDSISDKYFKNNLAGKISQLRVITFKKTDPTHVFIKKSMGNEAKSEKIFVLGKNRIPTDRLYKKPLPISDAKYNDLANHCKSSTIPRQFHDEYLKMPHGNIIDALPDTDMEDSD